VKKGVNAGLVSLESLNQVGTEAVHAIGENANAVEKVADHDGLEDVQLELTVHTTNGGSNVVTHHLGADHGKGLALSRVDLSGHDGRSRLVLGQNQLTQTATGTGTKVTDILGNLEQRASQGVQRTGSLNDRVVGSQDLELVGGGLELGAGHLADLSSDGLIEALEGVQTGTDGSTTLSKEAQVGDASLDTLNVAVQLGDITGELLAQSERGGILQVGTANLDQVLELLDLLLQSITQLLQRGQQSVLKLHHGGNVHDSGEGVVGGGRHIDVVVRVNGLLGAHGTTQNLDSTVGDDLVGVHVGLSARAGLPDDQREVIQQLTLSDLGGGLLNSSTNLGVYDV